MSTTALAFKCDELDDDLTPIEKLTVECWRCDPDNPLAVPRNKCAECQGTGRAPVALAAVMREIQQSRAELEKTSSISDEEFLEY
jgi:hypothetical protein